MLAGSYSAALVAEKSSCVNEPSRHVGSKGLVVVAICEKLIKHKLCLQLEELDAELGPLAGFRKSTKTDSVQWLGLLGAHNYLEQHLEDPHKVQNKRSVVQSPCPTIKTFPYAL